SDACLDYPGQLANQVLHPPEATAGEHRTFKLACHDKSSLRLDHTFGLWLSHQTSHRIDRMNPNLSAEGFDLTPPTLDERTSLEAGLTPEESDVLLRHGTEAAFCGGLLDEHRDGVFTCRLCGLPLFLAGHKFESGTGWPSFAAPFDEEHLERKRDTSYGM